MKKFTILFILLLTSVLCFAHPASKVELNFDQETHVLTVEFNHSVKDAAKHFVDEVYVYLNKEEIITQKLMFQQDVSGGKLSYIIPEAKTGDDIEVKTKCNKFGSKKGKITIE